MEMESQQQQQPATKNQISKHLRWFLMALNFAIMVIGSTVSPLLLRLYFLKGGSRKWLSGWLQTGGWPLIFIPLAISYAHRRGGGGGGGTKLYLMTPPLFLACTVLGLLIGLDDYLYAYGMSYLPVSTSSILISTQLGFTALFAFFIVKQKFTSFSTNAVVLLSIGAVMLGLHASGDRPEGESNTLYYLGFAMTLAAAVLYAFILPLVELTYAKAKQVVSYTLVMEMQLVMGFFATVFCTVGMLVSKDFQAISREARDFVLGEVRYYVLLVWSAILWQFFFLGTVGAIFYGSALLAGIIIAVLIPVAEVLAVIFFHESFSGGKGVALVLALWGLASYFYGEFLESKKKKPVVEPGLLDSANN
ncbi:purine permease 3-like [Phoenix dactylifera]|uniref:Probable purine permease n=1 Tax=Phoenix dactylifera TaxID=42345 RepID=A0A8B7D3G9_PHODC|nr:purine permease 3-like [Phoenix dactylifera]